MVDIDSIVDDGDGDALALCDSMGCLNVGTRSDWGAIDGGCLQMPLLWVDGSAASATYEFRMAVLDILPVQQRQGDVEDLGPRVLWCCNEEGVIGIRDFLLDREAGLRDHLTTLIGVRVVGELDEQVLRVENGLARLVHQNAARETHVGRRPQSRLPFRHGPSSLVSRDRYTSTPTSGNARTNWPSSVSATAPEGTAPTRSERVVWVRTAMRSSLGRSSNDASSLPPNFTVGMVFVLPVWHVVGHSFGWFGGTWTSVARLRLSRVGPRPQRLSGLGYAGVRVAQAQWLCSYSS